MRNKSIVGVLARQMNMTLVVIMVVMVDELMSFNINIDVYL